MPPLACDLEELCQGKLEFFVSWISPALAFSVAKGFADVVDISGYYV